MLRALPHRLVTFLVCFVVLSGIAIAQSGPGNGYVAGIPDLPLMPGLQELPEGGLLFDKPGGRIAEAFARGSVTPQSVFAFYDETLPQLGWRRAGRGSYQREGEQLELDLGQDARGTTVHFRLFPQ